MTIDEKIAKLLSITSNFPLVEYYSHERADCFKILNEYTSFREDKIVLCLVSDGFEKALDIAIEQISTAKDAYSK
jgi:hypothetical protein